MLSCCQLLRGCYPRRRKEGNLNKFLDLCWLPDSFLIVFAGNPARSSRDLIWDSFLCVCITCVISIIPRNLDGLQCLFRPLPVSRHTVHQMRRAGISCIFSSL